MKAIILPIALIAILAEGLTAKAHLAFALLIAAVSSAIISATMLLRYRNDIYWQQKSAKTKSVTDDQRRRKDWLLSILFIGILLSILILLFNFHIGIVAKAALENRATRACQSVIIN